MLYGDGIRDDAPAIQALLDAGEARVALPLPKAAYLIRAPLRLHSRQELTLPRYAAIRLADGCDCLMLRNADFERGNADIRVTGGVWDMNNLGQSKNPFHFPHPQSPDYNGFGMLFQNVKNLHVSDLTLKDPVTFAMTLDTARDFTVENLLFDFNRGNPWAVNMDGVHLNGNCHYGLIRNLKGACYDDLVALNADEGACGPISHIDIDGIFAEDCHSAVRLLSNRASVKHVHIRNVFGSFYQYCVGVTRYYGADSEGQYDAITLDDIHARKAVRHSVYRKDGSYVYAPIWVEAGLRVKSLDIRGLYREEENTAVPTVLVQEGSAIERMTLKNVSVENRTGEEMPLMQNDGRIDRLYIENLRADGDPLFSGKGEIGARIGEA